MSASGMASRLAGVLIVPCGAAENAAGFPSHRPTLHGATSRRQQRTGRTPTTRLPVGSPRTLGGKGESRRLEASGAAAKGNGGALPAGPGYREICMRRGTGWGRGSLPATHARDLMRWWVAALLIP